MDSMDNMGKDSRGSKVLPVRNNSVWDCAYKFRISPHYQSTHTDRGNRSLL